jgi:hypothetical protein
MIEAALLNPLCIKERAQGFCPVAIVRGSLCLEIINADISRTMQIPTRLGKDRRGLELASAVHNDLAVAGTNALGDVFSAVVLLRAGGPTIAWLKLFRYVSPNDPGNSAASPEPD